MAKTEATLQLERSLWHNTRKQGTFACMEVTIGINGHERVDFLTWETNGTWRAYEIKVTKEDFRSKAAKSFVGNFNYYVMPYKLYCELQRERPEGIGVRCECGVVVKPKRKKTAVSHEVLMTSLMRSMYREAEKYVNAVIEDQTPEQHKAKKEKEAAQRTIRQLRAELKRYRLTAGQNLFGKSEDSIKVYWREKAIELQAKLREMEARDETQRQ